MNGIRRNPCTGLAICLLLAAGCSSTPEITVPLSVGRILWTSPPLRIERTGHTSEPGWETRLEDNAVSRSLFVTYAKGHAKEMPPSPEEAVTFTATMSITWPQEPGHRITITLIWDAREWLTLSFDSSGLATFNEVPFAYSPGTTPQRIRIETDRENSSTRLFLNGELAREGKIADRAAGFDNDGLQVTLQASARDESSWPVVELSEISLYSDPATTIGIEDGESVLVRHAPGELIFAGESFSWKSIPPMFHGWTGVRTILDRQAPLRFFSRQDGYVYAALWTWDYGFLEHLPPAFRKTYNGWTMTDMVATVARAPEPFSRLPIYRRSFSEGGASIELDAYVGQWVILGFSASPGTGTPENAAEEILVSGARGRHNVVEQGQRARLDCPHPVISFAVYHDSIEVLKGNGDEIDTPTYAGRFALRAVTSAGTATVPFTVAFKPPSSAGWEKGFFPVHFYNGYSYQGLFYPNPNRLLDLQTLAMFELGANTFFLSAPNELVDLLHARKLLNIKSKTIPLTRKTPDAEEAATAFETLLASLLPIPVDTLGLYVEDEPPHDAATRLARMTQIGHRMLPSVPLLYTAQGEASPVLWEAVGSDVRMTRAYPIRKSYRRDLRRSIEVELSSFLEFVQSRPARAVATPLWLVVQAFGDRGRPNIWDPPSASQLRLMVNLALGRGVRALTFFCFDSSPGGPETLIGLARWPFVPENDLYDEVKRLNEGIRRLSRFLEMTSWEKAVVQEDRRFDVQALKSSGGKEYAWITNWDTDRHVSGAVRLAGDRPPLMVSLEPGGRAIVDLDSGAIIEPEPDR